MEKNFEGVTLLPVIPSKNEYMSNCLAGKYIAGKHKSDKQIAGEYTAVKYQTGKSKEYDYCASTAELTMISLALFSLTCSVTSVLPSISALSVISLYNSSADATP